VQMNTSRWERERREESRRD